MSEDRIRTMFRQADTRLGYAPPDLDETIRQAKRETAMRRGRWALGSAALTVIAVMAGWVAMRPEAQRVIPIASASPPIVAPAAPCGEIPAAQPGSITTQQAQNFLEDFMDRRVAGSGAEPCLSSGAVETYRLQQTPTYDPGAFGGAGSMCLYACGEFDITEYRLDSEPAQADANSFEAIMVVLLNNGQETVRVTEYLSIGPGEASTGHSQELVIRGATTTAGLP